MAQPFESRQATPGGLGGRLPGARARAAAAEIEGLLAAAERVTDISAEAIAELVSRHGLDLDRHLSKAGKQLYRRYLEHCLVDRALSDQEAEDLAHLRAILAVEEEVASGITDSVAQAIYGAAVDQALADHRLEPDEELFLSRLRSDLRIEAEAAEAALADGRERARQRYLAKVSDRDDVFVSSQELKLKLEGTSEVSLEAAVENALVAAADVLPGLNQVEITAIHADVSNGAIARWHVAVRARIEKD